MQNLTRSRALPTLVGAWLFWMAGSVCSPAAAQDAADIYTVGGIAVDETGMDGSTARAAALRSGERVAFDRLLQWLLLKEDVARIPDDVRANPSRFVTGYSVQNERIAANRYRATIEVQFDRDRVRNLMGELDLIFEEHRPPTHLLIPLLGQGGQLTLWDNNPWLDIWANRPSAGDFIPLLVPHGELGDVSALSVAEAAGGQTDRIAGLARRYGVTHALLVRADQVAEGRQVTVSVVLTDRGQPIGDSLRFQLRRAADESGADFLGRTAMTTARAAADLWIQSVRDRRAADGIVAVRAEFGDFREWRRLLTEVQRSSRLAHVTIRRLTTRHSDLLLHYSGTVDAVREALTAIGLEVETAGDPWLLRFAATEAPPPVAAPVPDVPVEPEPPAPPVVD